MLRNIRHLLLLSLLSSSLLGCTGSVEQATPPPDAAAQAVAVLVAPAQVEAAPGGQVAFAATVTGTANTAVSWGVQETGGGTVNATGLYTAPSSAGTFHVTATSSADPSKQGSATVTVTAPQPIVAVTVSPASGSVNACRTLQFTATVTGSTNTAVAWSVQEGAAGGTVTAGGLYTAPTGPGTYHVVATSAADPAKSFVATVTVTEAVLSVAVTPQTVSLPPGGTAQLTATVTNTCGTFTATNTVTASASGVVTVD